MRTDAETRKQRFLTSTSCAAGTGNGTSTSSKCSARGSPLGRARSRISREVPGKLWLSENVSSMYKFWASHERLVTRIPRPSTRPRKQPRQARSRATVDAVIEAGARILGSGGFGAFNTNEVARVAGVSVGTVYQYFPNKIALVEAIRERHFAEVLAVVQCVASGTKPLAARVAALVDGMSAVHGASPALHRALLEEAPSTRRGDAADESFKHAYLDAYSELLRSASTRKLEPPLSIAASVLAAAVEGAVHDAARNGTLESRRFRAAHPRLSAPLTAGTGAVLDRDSSPIIRSLRAAPPLCAGNRGGTA